MELLRIKFIVNDLAQGLLEARLALDLLQSKCQLLGEVDAEVAEALASQELKRLEEVVARRL